MRAVKYAAYTVLLIVICLSVWGLVIEPRLIEVNQETAVIPGLPSEWEGQRVAVVADYQVGMWGANVGTARRISERIAESRPAAVLLSGDFVYHAGADAADHLETVVEILAPLTAAGIPTYAVLGNHDYSLDVEDEGRDDQLARAVEEALSRAGVRVLENEAVALELPVSGENAQPLYLVGIGSEWAERANPDEALQQVPSGAPRLVFMHNPESFTRIPPEAAPVALAGHTHGGQIRLPWSEHWSWISIVREGETHADGWIADPSFGQRGNRLYVNRGVGFSDVPARINCRPELTYLTLTGAPLPPRDR